MNRWSVTVTSADGEHDRTEISDVGDLARTVGAAVVMSARNVVIVAVDADEPMPVISIDDPIETGRQAALGQWEARWAALQATLKLTGTWGASHDLAFAKIEAEIPTGLPVADGRITFRLEPDEVTDLVRLLDDIGTLKVHSLRTNSEAINLSAEIKRVAEQQGWRP
jgi:hypothetical protein